MLMGGLWDRGGKRAGFALALALALARLPSGRSLQLLLMNACVVRQEKKAVFWRFSDQPLPAPPARHFSDVQSQLGRPDCSPIAET
jgi:hypothetical protein